MSDILKGFMMEYEFKHEKFWTDVRVGRARYDISQEQVAQEFGVKESTFSLWEAGKRKLPAERFMALCYMLDLDPIEYYRTADLPAWKKPQPPMRQTEMGEYVYRTQEEIDRFDRLDLDADAPVGYHRERADMYDYYRADREANW